MVVEEAYGFISKGNGDCILTKEKHTALTVGGGQAGQGYPCALITYAIDMGGGKSRCAVSEDVSPTLSCGGAAAILRDDYSDHDEHISGCGDR